MIDDNKEELLEVSENTSFWRQILDRYGNKPVDPIVFHSLVLKFEISLKVDFLAPESGWKAACHSTKMFLLGIEPKIYCILERFCFILSMFWNTKFTRKIQSFIAPTFQLKQWITKCIKSTMFDFLAFYSLEYTRSDDTKFMILLSYQSGVTSWSV